MAQHQGICFDLPFIFCCFLAFILIVLFFSIAAGSGNEFAVEDEGDFDAAEVVKSTVAAFQPPFASLERLGVEISVVPAKILSFFREFDRVTVSQYRPQNFWVFDRAEIDFYDYSVPRDRIQFLEAIWKKYGNFISHFKLGNFVRGAMLTLLCCVLAQLRDTNLEDVTETKILEWKSVVQELVQEGFLLVFIFEHFPRLLETYLAKGIAAEITAEAAYRVVAEAADDVVTKVVDAVILKIIVNASNLREILVVGETPVI